MVRKIPPVQLEKIPFFAGIPQQLIDTLTPSSTVRIRPSKAGVYYPDDTADSVFFLLEGRVKLGIVSEDGREVIKRVVAPGEMFGESALLGSTVRTEFAIPMKLDAVMVSVRSADLLRAIQSNSELINRFIQHLGERIKVSESKMEDYVLQDSRARIIDFIVDMDLNARDEDGKAYHFMTHQDIAGLTGASRQFVTSVLNELRRRKLIDFNRIAVTVKDRKGLMKAK